MRTASAEHVQLRSPIPDNTIIRNVERLERSAEELSQGGSDIGEEIRKLQDEQRQASRRSSLNSRIHPSNVESPFQLPPPSLSSLTRTRGASTSSYSNSILDLNREARFGGYSPGAFVGSPAASIHSGMLSRTASNTMSHSQRPEPLQEGRPLDSPLTASLPLSRETTTTSDFVHLQSTTSPTEHDQTAARPGSLESIRGSDAGVAVHPATSAQIASDREGQPLSESHEPAMEELEQQTPAERPSHSSHGSHKADTLFRDFDGVHFSPQNEEFVAVDKEGNVVGRVTLDEAADVLTNRGLPPPAVRRQSNPYRPATENMVYYPAPVPRILNLPKRLSARPASQVMLPRQSQLIKDPPRSNTRNTMTLPRMDFEHLVEEPGDELQQGPGQKSDRSIDEPPSPASTAASRRIASHPGHSRQKSSISVPDRNSRSPPQLRASVFFDQPPQRQSVSIQSGSAVATLDSILKAAATAPVSVFTDHPIVGRAGRNVYAKEHVPKRNTMSGPLVVEARNRDSMLPAEATARATNTRSVSFHPGDAAPRAARRNSVISMLTDLGNPESNKLRKKSSKLSLGSADLLDPNDGARSRSQSPAASVVLGRTMHPADEDLYNDDYEEDPDDPDMGPVYSQPTTLLAELQMRKAQQKSRNRTAATAFPDGMHATLLELDAVAQIEVSKRKSHKVALAWEEPEEQLAEEDAANQDIPLGMLFPFQTEFGQNKTTEGEWDRPLGLIERRQLEDNEPLSMRRSRLLGLPAQSYTKLSQDVPEEHDSDEDLPLAERRRKMQQKAALDGALGDVHRQSRISLGDEIMSSLGIPPAKSPTLPQDHGEGEETLGQRLARLKREKAAKLSQGAVPEPAGRPPLRPSASLSNVLGAVPADGMTARRDGNSFGSTSLLAVHDSEATQHKAQMREHNARKSSYQDPRASMLRSTSQAFTDTGYGHDAYAQANGLVAGAGGGVTARRGSNPLGTLQSSTSLSGFHALALQSKLQAGYAQQDQMMNPLAFSNFVPPAPSTGMGFSGGMAAAPTSYNMNGLQHGMFNHGGYLQPGLYAQQTAYTQHPAGYHHGAQQVTRDYNMMYSDGLNSNQRDTIDRWRSGVA